MAKRKKIELITGIGRDPERQMTVQKSTPLYALWRSELTLTEFKILDTYLSRIDSHKPEKRTVCFEKREIEQLLGVKKINTPELKERLKNLGTMVEVDDPTKTRSFRLVSLFEQAECEQDENGIWQVGLTCTTAAMKYIFNVENLGYLRYKLRAVTALRSRYSYILFLYLEKNRFRRSWEVEVDELRHILRCDDEETYQAFKRFNDLILKRCRKELLEKTDCCFTYEPIKKGRSVKSIRFVLKTLPEIEPNIPVQMTLEEFNLCENDQIEFLRKACSSKEKNKEPEFSRLEMEQIFEILVILPDSKLPLPENVPTGGMDFRRYHYLAERYAAMNRVTEKKSIKNRFAYFLSMLKRDAGVE